MTDLQIFNNDRFGQVRIIPVDGELMFVAKDVCDCLEITKHRDAISRLDSDERGSVKLDTPGGKQDIAEFKPVKDYVDKILSSKSCLAITQIAADYGLSAQELNKILHEAGLQRKVGDQWILYKQHMAKGFTKSETFTFCRSDGRLDSKITTKWTQKGRLEIHSILTKLNIHAVCEDVA